MESEHKKPKKPKPSKFVTWWRWPIIVLAISFILSLAFGVVSEIALTGASIAVSVVVILVFIGISIIGDMIGVAVTAASLEPFRAMAARKVRGSKEAIKLIKNKDKVASICADVVGDICGILSGAAGTSITVIVVMQFLGSFWEVFLASLVSAVIAALTIFGKCFLKKYSIKHSEKIILILGKFLSIFHIQRKNDNSNKKNKKNSKKEEKKKKVEDKKDNLEEKNCNIEEKNENIEGTN